VEDLGESAIVDLQVGEAIVKMRTDRRPAAKEGEAVHVAFDPSSLHLFDAVSGQRRVQ
jgi:ABC-type sugar transport system ATPase subunit